MNLRRLLRNLISTAILLSGTTAAADSAGRDPDSVQPVHIEADRLQADQKQQYARYIGHVHVRQGKFELFAEQLDAYLHKGALKKLVATGHPARFRKYDYASNSWTHGQALTITYDITPEKRLLLEKDAKIVRDKGEQLSSARILYHVKTDTITAESRGKARVHVVLPPQQETSP